MISAEGDEPSPRPQGRKRYSSSFGHRYAAAGGGAGSEGSAGSADRKEIERPGVGLPFFFLDETVPESSYPERLVS